MKLYELVLKDGHAVSPFVWRARMALAHKGLDYDSVPIGYGDKDQLAFSGQDRVPVLEDGKTVVSDSWRIACHLEEAYPDQPSLFGGEGGRAAGLFFNRWADTQQLGNLFLLCTPGTFDLTPEADQEYFRKSRFEWSGMTIEQMRDDPAAKIARLHGVLEPVRLTLQEQAWLAGDQPGFLDYCLFGGFMWARTTTDYRLLDAEDPVEQWRQRMLDLFDGLARKAPAIQQD
ncbi:MAG: glutathione S-transferase N-terminal domain-containing protein [Alphaproteobacteria bacterium]